MKTDMKTIFRIFSAAAVAALLFTSCETERITYDGPSYIAFADTLNICPVTESGEAWLLPVAATTACGYDRTFGVELIPGKSNAVYGKHFTLESQSVTIKAGKM